MRAGLGRARQCWLSLYCPPSSLLPFPSALSSNPPRHCPSTSPVPFCAGGGGWAPIPEFLPSKVLQPPQRCLLTSLLRPPALLQPRKQKIASCQIGILNSDHARNSLLPTAHCTDEFPAGMCCRDMSWAAMRRIREASKKERDFWEFQHLRGMGPSISNTFASMRSSIDTAKKRHTNLVKSG